MIRTSMDVRIKPKTLVGAWLSGASDASGHNGAVKVQLRNPRREVEVDGPMNVSVLLDRLDIHRDSVLVIRDGELVPGDERLPDDATVEIRPVVSGGCA